MLKKILIAGLILLLFQTVAISQKLPPKIHKQIENLSIAEQIDSLGRISWLLRESDNDLAIQCGKYALSLADSLKLYRQSAQINNFLGVNMLYYIYETRLAWNYFRDALSNGVKAKDSVQIGYAYDNMGYMYLIHGDISNAQVYGENAMKVFRNLNFEQGLAYSYSNLGLTYQALKQYDAAMALFQQAIDIHTKNNNEIGMAAVMSCIGETHLLQQNPDSALFYFEGQLKIAESNGHKKYMARALKGIGEVHHNRGNNTEALRMLEKAMDLCIEKNDNHLLIDIHISKALVFAETGRISEGENELQEALVLARKLRLPKSVYSIRKAYSALLNNGMVNKEANEIFLGLFELYNSLYEDLQKETIKNENLQFQTSQSLEQAKAEINMQTATKRYLFVIVFLSVLLAFVLLWRFQSKKLLYQKLQKKNLDIEREMDEKNRVLEALRNSEEELKNSNVVKDKFFSIIAHDLKSPFNAILGLSELLYENHSQYGERQAREMVKLIRDSADRTLHLLENLLVWSQSQGKRMEFRPVKLGLKLVVDEIFELQHSAARKKSIALANTVSGRQTVRADREMLNTVLRNLVSNAIKFTPDRGIITAGASEHSIPGFVVVWLEDTGMGIPEEMQDSIFGLANSETKRGRHKNSGTGLGLVLCREFVEMHGGTIWVESLPGEGSKFSFSLPLDSDNVSGSAPRNADPG